MPVVPFSTLVDRRGETTVVSLGGELDIATVPELRSLAFAELDRNECRALILDLAELSFVDSTGIGSWIEIRLRAIGMGKTLILESVSAAVGRVLEISGLLALFTAP
ncbi:MAG: STAS domain-containing protein [Jatrophihabitantaceae bacterium]